MALVRLVQNQWKFRTQNSNVKDSVPTSQKCNNVLENLQHSSYGRGLEIFPDIKDLVVVRERIFHYLLRSKIWFNHSCVSCKPFRLKNKAKRYGKLNVYSFSTFRKFQTSYIFKKASKFPLFVTSLLRILTSSHFGASIVAQNWLPSFIKFDTNGTVTPKK